MRILYRKAAPVLLFLLLASFLYAASAEAFPAKAAEARPSVNGWLHVEDGRLVDESGEAVQLRGVSTHGLTWFPEFVDGHLFEEVSQDWKCNLIRLAMYSELYCGGEKEKSLSLLRKGIEAAVEADMYVIVDWHILKDSNPNENLDAAREFFAMISSEYSTCPNVIYEICNEPNGETDWSDILDYSHVVIPVIRENCPGAVVLVGTPEYDKNLSAAVLRPLDLENVMYVLHFYAATHGDGLMSELKTAVDAGLPVFISECGICEASGDGTIDFSSAAAWFEYLNENEISYAVWSLSDKDETSAFFRPGFDPSGNIRDEDLTLSGKWIRELIRGTVPGEIPTERDVVKQGRKQKAQSWITNSLGDRGYEAVSKWLVLAGAAVAIFLAGLLMALIYRKSTGDRKTYDTARKYSEAGPGDGTAAADMPGAGAVLDGTPAEQGVSECRNDGTAAADMPGAGAVLDDGPAEPVVSVRRNNGTAGRGRQKRSARRAGLAGQAVLVVSVIFTIIYLGWRVAFSVPVGSGVPAVLANLLLLVVEVFGFAESLVLFTNLMGMREHPLPEIPADRYPDVDIFVSTYNEPVELLRKTLAGCRHMKYPDPSKVHIWLCDDNRRPAMRALAEEMQVGYFDRPDNKGAKAGNLNHALSLTSSPYIVTFDADMIPKSDFLMKTIPYFVDVEMGNEGLPEAEMSHLGLLQTPQCFYEPDVFQHALYSENRVPNEQDFFYRTIEPSKTTTNSVIYGGSNTVLSRRALEDCGGFYTESITEDFATGILIESKGYLSLGLPEPLASGQTPHTYREHIQQRTRWGRGVIRTARKLKIWRNPSLSLLQKISYWSSVVYWYSPIKNLIYILSPLIFAAFAIPVFRCNWLELVVYWLPMFLVQDLSLRVNSRKKISLKWSGIYETSVMPHLLIPVIKELLGITLSTFKVTDKSQKGLNRETDWRAMLPFLALTGLSVWGIVRLCVHFEMGQLVSFLILMFWIIRNLYFLIVSLFLVDGRDYDGEDVKVYDAEPVVVKSELAGYEGVTTRMTEHNLTVFLDGDEKPPVGAHVTVEVSSAAYSVTLSGVVTGRKESRGKLASTETIEILDFGGAEDEYLSILYDRVPTLPQTLSRDLGIFGHLWQNIAQRVARTIR